MQVKHLKTGHFYELENNNVINATNASDGQLMCLYYNAAGQAFVREYNEFWQKFEKVEDGSEKQLRLF